MLPVTRFWCFALFVSIREIRGLAFLFPDRLPRKADPSYNRRFEPRPLVACLVLRLVCFADLFDSRILRCYGLIPAANCARLT